MDNTGRWVEIVFLALISGLTYLPRIGELTYYRDDWYFLYDALVIGPKALIEIALHTRPIRGPLYALYFSLFGLHPLPYHIVMYLTRLVGGVGALWLFNLIWPKNRHANFFMAVLFLLFPGFLWWVAGFEFQPYVLSLSLQVFSIAFTLKAISSDSVKKRLFWTVAALLSGWAYLALVEYAIGMEVFRVICVYLFVRRKAPSANVTASLVQTMKTAGPHLLIPLVFLVWYQFLFDNWRKAQDAGTQFSALFSSPVTIIWRLMEVARSFLNVSLFAWVVPFYQNFYGNRLRELLIGLFFAIFAIGLVYIAFQYLNSTGDDPEVETDIRAYSLQKELLWVGLFGTLAGVLPVVLANRIVTFERISQYALPASLAGVIFLSGLVYSMFPQKIRLLMLMGLTGLAVLTHHGLAAQAVDEEKTISEFWEQVVLRVPDLRSGTTLVVSYPDINYLEGNDVVWGPANFIYYPEQQGKMPVEITLPASRLEQDSILQIINGNKSFDQTDLVIKFIHTETDYRNQLIISQPSQTSCVHVLDPRWPDLSIYDQPFIHASYQHSKIENVITNADFHALPTYAFDSELKHDWCSYYQKADLARQQGNWEEVARLGREAEKFELHPNDQIELMPFLQAYAFLGDEKQVKGISTRINTISFYRQLACGNLTAMGEHGYQLSHDMQSYVYELFCE
jgi:hypothetical protein